ncbi:MAG: LppX_LprAFG lipoprotein [Anaerolineales bacterium]|nr:LppX_LprAFG lipoprotein [Anaerolineales bacterium]
MSISKPALCNSLTILIGMLAIVFLAACQSIPAAPPPDEIVQRTAEQMQGLAGFHFVIERSGAPAYLDAAETLAFRRAEGDYVAPDRAQAIVRVIGPGLIAEVQVVSIADDYWETHVLTGQWQKLPPEQGFNPATLFDPQTGIRPVLAEDLKALEYLGPEELEELPGQKLYALQGQVNGERLSALSFGLISKAEMQAKLWVAPQTFELYRLVLIDERSEMEEATIWQFDFWDFGTVVNIQPPLEGE